MQHLCMLIKLAMHDHCALAAMQLASEPGKHYIRLVQVGCYSLELNELLSIDY